MVRIVELLHIHWYTTEEHHLWLAWLEVDTPALISWNKKRHQPYTGVGRTELDPVRSLF